jgi:RimJ/RimL family protein N-acetyltransferase
MKKFNSPIQLETSRLILRQWKPSDLKPFAHLNADPEVMLYFPSTLSIQQSDLLAEKFQNLITVYGWGMWAVELKENHQFIGCVGLADQPEKFSFSPCVEIAWRLDHHYWDKGYATEAAQACLNFAFNQLVLEQVVAFTAVLNQASEKVMQRLGMDYVCSFKHPSLDEQHVLAKHVLYRIVNPHL